MFSSLKIAFCRPQGNDIFHGYYSDSKNKKAVTMQKKTGSKHSIQLCTLTLMIFFTRFFDVLCGQDDDKIDEKRSLQKNTEDNS